MMKKGKPTQDKKGQYLRRDSSFNIRDLVMRTPTSSSPDRSPDVYNEEKQTKTPKQERTPEPTPAEHLRTGNEKIGDLINELQSFDVNTIQRRSDPKMKALTVRINDLLAEIFGRNTDEYDDYVIYSLDTLPITIGGSWYPLPEVREGYQKGIHSAIKKLSSLLAAHEKKIKALTSDKITRPVSHEYNENPVLAAKEKVSLVNLRGKIRSRETILFSQSRPASGNEQARRSLISETVMPEKTIRQDQHGNSFFPIQAEKNEIPDSQGDQRSDKETPGDRKNVILLENLEEKLKKLEEEMPGFETLEQENILSGNQELQIISIQKGLEKELPKEPGHEEVPLATLMAKLNEIASSEPEYVEAYTKMVPGKKEKVIPLLEDKDRTDAAIDTEAPRTFFMEMDGLESSGLEMEEEVLIIDGDNVLSSESNFIEALEGDRCKQETIEPDKQNDFVSNVSVGKTRILLEELEEKLREFEGQDIAIRELPTDFERTGCEEVLLVEATDDLPEEMMDELSQETRSVEVCEKKFNNEEVVLVIDGDEGLFQEPVALESMGENTREEEMLIENEEILVIDCNSRLPEDVSDELTGDEDLCEAHEGEPQRLAELAENNATHNSLDEHLLHPYLNEQFIIQLMSQATPFDISLHSNGGYKSKAVLLEDLEQRLKDFDSLQPAQESLNTIQFYDIEEAETLPEDREAHDQITEKHCVDSTDSICKQQTDSSMTTFFGHDFLTGTPVQERIIEPMACVTLEHEIPEYEPMQLAHTPANTGSTHDMKEEMLAELSQECQISEAMVDEILELSEATVYGETPNLESQKGFLPTDWDEILYYEDTLSLIENALLFEPTVKASTEDPTEEQVCIELPEQILLKDFISLADYEYETLITSPVDLLAFETTLIETYDERLDFEMAGSAKLDSSFVLPAMENVDLGAPNAFGEEIPEEAVFIVSNEELAKEAAGEVKEENEMTPMELPERGTSVHEYNLIDRELIRIGEEEEFQCEATTDNLDETVFDANDPQQVLMVPQQMSDQTNTESILTEPDYETALSPSEDLTIEPVLAENNIEIPQMNDMEKLVQDEEGRELSLLEPNDLNTTYDNDSLPQNEAFEMTAEFSPSILFENNFTEHEPLSLEAFDKHLSDPECDMLSESEIEESSRDTILLEALEEMLSNLATSIPEENTVKPEIKVPQSTSQPIDEKVVVIDSNKETQKKAVLIKNKEDRHNPFAVADFGRESSQSKTLRADDILAQIGELRYRIDDLRTFDIDSIEQRFDPRVRALGDTVNNSIADIFGRNTPAYWQHALPSLDSLPVVVGGPKLSPEEIRDAYRRRINDAISKVNLTIDVLEVKLGNMEGKGPGGQVLFLTPKAPKYPDIQSLR